MVRIIQPLCGLLRQAGQHPPAAQEAPSLHILLSSLWLGGTRDSRRAQGPGECRLQTEDDEAIWLPTCLGDVCGERGGEFHTLGGLSGELRVLCRETCWYPQVNVSPSDAFRLKDMCDNSSYMFHLLSIVTGPNISLRVESLGWTCVSCSPIWWCRSILVWMNTLLHCFVFFILII